MNSIVEARGRKVMSNTVMFRPTLSNPRQTLIPSKSVSGTVRFAEVAGGTTAECAAVFCCCPCIAVNFLILAIYKVPAGLCRRVLRIKHRQSVKNKKAIHPARLGRFPGGILDDADVQVITMEKTVYSEEAERKVVELEKEMWDVFYSTGFWRSPSQRDQISSSN